MNSGHEWSIRTRQTRGLNLNQNTSDTESQPEHIGLLTSGYLARKNFHRKQGEVGFLPVVAIATKANWSFTLVGTYIFHERGHSETISKRDIGHSADSPGLETEV